MLLPNSGSKNDTSPSWLGGVLEAGDCSVSLDGKSAATQWSPVCSGPLPVHGTATLLNVQPKTGRTHQIRRHLAHMEHPIVGEHLYPKQHEDAVETMERYTGHGLFLSAVGMHIPEGRPWTRDHRQFATTTQVFRE